MSDILYIASHINTKFPSLCMLAHYYKMLFTLYACTLLRNALHLICLHMTTKCSSSYMLAHDYKTIFIVYVWKQGIRKNQSFFSPIYDESF